MWQKPVLRGLEDGHRQATWIELFFDLIFVVAVAQLAIRLAENVSWGGVAGYAFVYFPIWTSWVAATLYANRFDTDDLGQRLITFAQMLTVAGMAASVAESAAVQFAISVALFRALTVISYIRIRISISEARVFANRLIGSTTISAGIWIASVFMQDEARLAAWTVALGIEIVATLLPTFRKGASAVLFQVDHLFERFGLFTIIVLGETVLAVVIGVAHAHWAASAVIFAAIGLTISFSLWWIYFETVTGKPLAHLGSLRPIAWVYAQAPLVMAITALGVGIELAVFAKPGETLPTAHALILSGSLAIALLALGLILAAETPRQSTIRVLAKRSPAIVLALIIGLAPISAQAAIVGLAVVAAAQGIVDVRASRHDASPQHA